MRPMFSATAVVCKRGQKFDAEVQFKEETFMCDGSSDVKYNQRLIKAGFNDQEVAKAVAEGAAADLEETIRLMVDRYLSKYKEAKP
jgi:hypothetical protein